MRSEIVADEQIGFVERAFGDFGRLRTMPAQAINSRTIADSHILLVRSVTKVNEALLRGTKIRFVGTMTSGIDHVDRGYLRNENIGFAYAPGSNANAVAEYVIAALLCTATRKNIKLSGKTIGVIGVGHIGRLVIAKAAALGMNVLMNDPPLKKRTGSREFVPLERLRLADIITLHVPLTYRGIYATYHLIDHEFLARVRKGTILINTSRGPVVEESALIRNIYRLGTVILDVWENEPHINPKAASIADIGTPHIAGYTLDAKARATAMVRERLARYLRKEPSEQVTLLGTTAQRTIRIDCRGRTDEEVIGRTVLQVYNPEEDGKKMRGLLDISGQRIARQFENLRNTHDLRREFSDYRLVLSNCPPALGANLMRLGFTDIEC